MYQIFHRTWWKRNQAFPGGYEPEIGEKTIIGYKDTIEKAVEACEQWNKDYERTHRKNLRSRKAEFTSDY